jgi:hypothetical protein
MSAPMPKERAWRSTGMANLVVKVTRLHHVSVNSNGAPLLKNLYGL